MTSPEQSFDPFISRTGVRITTLYSTRGRRQSPQPSGLPLTAGLRLGRLASHYHAAGQQLPLLLRNSTLTEPLGFSRFKGTSRKSRIWIFSLPGQEITLALSVNVDCELRETIPLLEDLYYGSLTISGQSLEDWFRWATSDFFSEFILGPERHQLLFAAARGENRATIDTIQRLIYRADLPAREGSSIISYPGELNRRPTTLGALGPYVSVLIGQQDYLENSCFISAVQLLGAHANLREISQKSYSIMERYRRGAGPAATLSLQRAELGETAAALSDLELDLSFRVEAAANIALLVPALRVEAYHSALYSMMGMSAKLSTTENLLTRLRNSIQSAVAALESQERTVDDRRRLRATVAISFVTTTVGAIGLVFAFFGANSTEVDAERSMLDSYYWPIYSTVLLIFATAASLFLVIGRRRPRGR